MRTRNSPSIQAFSTDKREKEKREKVRKKRERERESERVSNQYPVKRRARARINTAGRFPVTSPVVTTLACRFNIRSTRKRYDVSRVCLVSARPCDLSQRGTHFPSHCARELAVETPRVCQTRRRKLTFLRLAVAFRYAHIAFGQIHTRLSSFY
ncbi:hypothetical protein ACS0PU_002950 [Formica fusca]